METSNWTPAYRAEEETSYGPRLSENGLLVQIERAVGSGHPLSYVVRSQRERDDRCHISLTGSQQGCPGAATMANESNAPPVHQRQPLQMAECIENVEVLAAIADAPAATVSPEIEDHRREAALAQRRCRLTKLRRVRSEAVANENTGEWRTASCFRGWHVHFAVKLGVSAVYSKNLTRYCSGILRGMS